MPREIRPRRASTEERANQRYTVTELAFITLHLGTRTLAAIATEIGRNADGVRAVAKRHGIIPTARHKGVQPNPERVGAVAAQLGVSDYAVRCWVRAGVLAATSVGTGPATTANVRISREAVLAFLRDYRFLYRPTALTDPAIREYVAALPGRAERRLTPIEVAARLGYSGYTVREWLRRGDLAGLLVGGRYYVSEAALAAFTPDHSPARRGSPSAVCTKGRAARQATRERNQAALMPDFRPHGERGVSGALLSPAAPDEAGRK